MLFAAALITACGDVENPDLGKDSKWIQFGAKSYSGNEGDGKIMVPIQLASIDNPDDLSVQFTFESSDNTKFNVVPADGNVTIPKGEFEAFVEITPVDNSDVNENLSIKLSLVENDKYKLGLAGEGLEQNSTTVTILDDDCPLDITQFYGTYLANEDGYCDGCYEVVVSAGPVPNTLTLSNLYETGGTTIIELDNSNPSSPLITYRSKEFDAALQVSSTYGNVWATTPSDNSSSFRTCDQYMDLYFRRCVSIGCFSGQVHIQLTKK